MRRRVVVVVGGRATADAVVGEKDGLRGSVVVLHFSTSVHQRVEKRDGFMNTRFHWNKSFNRCVCVSACGVVCVSKGKVGPRLVLPAFALWSHWASSSASLATSK